ncbi:hypothetical protein [Kiritimatiella glycovorans]|uniref:Uncharacterized protein n=1 Tax=Kiritimatiella glycovorans TaxID=1307763 RepID=A0A0G3EE50_9BACT|nr:hypothetical protein [Kiritimatiella glycovorans]AKJ64593.1 hypothetical protein L21SP4_01345 [Kiritimatiella glycovorans]
MGLKTWLLALLTTAAAASQAGPDGYPRPMLFRENFPKLLSHYDHIQLMVSDLHVDKRKFSSVRFKREHPDAVVLVQINNEPTGIWGTWEMLPRQRIEDYGWLDPEVRDTSPLMEIFEYDIHPLMDFPGHWVYETGAETRDSIPADAETITVGVGDMTPFLPLTHRLSKKVAKAHPEITNALLKDVVIYTRGTDEKPDWLNADMGSLVAIDPAARTVTIRRWDARENRHAFDAGAVVAPGAVPVIVENAGVVRSFPPHLRESMKQAVVVKPFMPNLTPFCPVDPRTGLNAAETMARHYAAMRRRHYPNIDGYVFDVSCGTHTPSHRVSNRVDCDNDGEIDNFQFDGVLAWPVGISEFATLLRKGKPGHFKGLGRDFRMVSDSNFNEDQRLFEVLNGGEYEHSFTLFFPPYEYMYSSNLDRWLLWEDRGRDPNLSFVHNKYADEVHHGGEAADLERPATLAHFRLDMATACMGSGYVGKMVLRPAHGGNTEEVKYPGLEEERARYGGMLPKIYDEYHAGRGEFGWLGLPEGDPVRVTTHLSKPVYAFTRQSPMPAVRMERPPWRLSEPERTRTGDGFSFRVRERGLWRQLKDSFRATVALPLPGVELERNREYTLSFKLRGSPVYDRFGRAHRNIPKNMRLRFITDRDGGKQSDRAAEELNTNVGQLLGGGQSGGGYMQEVLVFPRERKVVLTLIAGGSGPAQIEFGVTEEPGNYEISDLRLREGCADVLVREFEHGLVLLNGSVFSEAVVDLRKLFPDAAFRRIRGTQDPVHNSGKPARVVTISASDGLFLEREDRAVSVRKK